MGSGSIRWELRGVKIVAVGLPLFDDIFNVFDMVIVAVQLIFTVLDLFDLDMPSVGALRLLRLLKLGRSTRVLKLFPELHLMLQGLVGVIKPIFYGLTLVCF